MADDDETDLDFEGEPTPSPRRGAPITLGDASESRKRRRALVHGVPAVSEALQLLLEGQLTAEDYATIEALRKSDHIDSYVMLMTFAKRFIRDRKDQRSGNDEAARAVAVAVKDQDDRLKVMEKRARWTDKAIWFAVVAVAGSLVAVGNAIWSRSANETAMEYRMRAVEREHERHPFGPSQKDTQP